MGFQVVVDLDPPGVRDPVLISLGFVLASACVRLRLHAANPASIDLAGELGGIPEQ
jgi:hypothetical protein